MMDSESVSVKSAVQQLHPSTNVIAGLTHRTISFSYHLNVSVILDDAQSLAMCLVPRRSPTS